MNYKILVAGHEGNLSLVVIGRAFTGTFTSDNGSGAVMGSIAADGSYEGTAAMGGHHVGFVAAINDNVITGKFHFGWIPVHFEGVAV